MMVCTSNKERNDIAKRAKNNKSRFEKQLALTPFKDNRIAYYVSLFKYIKLLQDQVQISSLIKTNSKN